MIAKALDKDPKALQATNGLFNDHADATDRLVFRLLLWGQGRGWIGFGLSWFLVGHLDRLRRISFLNALIPEIKPEDEILKPCSKGLRSAPFREWEVRIIDS